MADVAPTIGRMLGASFNPADGEPIPAVLHSWTGKVPRLILTVVWDGGGWDVLTRWPHSYPVLKRMMGEGVSLTRAMDGSSPSVTPAIHTTLGTGDYPRNHGITDIPVFERGGKVVDAFLEGRSSRFLRVPTLAESWDEQNGNQAMIGMVGYEPWHLGMIGQGSERRGGDKDDAAWLTETNKWTTNPHHYRLPAALPATKGLQTDLHTLDAADGRVDGAWRDNHILSDPSRIEEAPSFINYQSRGLLNIIASEGYGRDRTTDLMFTNFKQIDRNGHYYNLVSPEVHDSLRYSDQGLGILEDGLNREVGKRNWMMVVTADHGIQPDQRFVDGYGVNPRKLANDIENRFGDDIVQALWETQIFLDSSKMASLHVSVSAVARYIDSYRLVDNAPISQILLRHTGEFSPSDHLFAMAVPSKMLENLRCGQ